MGMPKARPVLSMETNGHAYPFGPRTSLVGAYLCVHVDISQRTCMPSRGLGRITAIAVFCGIRQLEGTSVSMSRRV